MYVLDLPLTLAYLGGLLFLNLREILRDSSAPSDPSNVPATYRFSHDPRNPKPCRGVRNGQDTMSTGTNVDTYGGLCHLFDSKNYLPKTGLASPPE